MRRTMALVETPDAARATTAPSAIASGSDPAQSRPPGTRCKACQLQLCKGRNEPPHAALGASTVVRDAGRGSSDTAFICKTCGITMVHSADLSRPGWAHAR